MITKEQLEAKLNYYKIGKQQATVTLEQAKANLNAFNGAVEVLEDLLKLEAESEKQKPESKAEKEAKAT
jgi:hypothetical protein